MDILNERGFRKKEVVNSQLKGLTNNQKRVAERIDPNATAADWKNWKWQVKHSVKDIETFERLTGIELPVEDWQKIELTLNKFPLSITPYYLSLIEKDNYQEDPVFLQSFPSPSELIMQKYDMKDPLHEDKDSPVPFITHRYPDRVLFHVSNLCSMYCRHCTRKRKVGEIDTVPKKEELFKAIEYLREHKEVRDVLLSGGDPFMLSDNYIDWILNEIHSIPHVEVIRIGTRMPVVLPYRITTNLIEILKKYHPLFVNTHFNHPAEVTSVSRAALKSLADAGIPLGNQTVLLAGVNDCPKIIKRLCHHMVKNRVKPYYLYQCDLSEGLTHFRTPIGKGIEIIESMIGHTSGFAVPSYVIDAPGGGGKIPVMPNYLISWSTNKVVLRNYEGVITTYKEPDSYEPTFCDRNCDECDKVMKLDNDEDYTGIGIERLLNDVDSDIALIPKGNERHTRR